MNSLTLAICTLNREFFLSRCLKALADQTQEFPSVKILIIDNGSVDNTRSLVLNFQNEIEMSYVLESRTGLSHARNKAIECCDTDYLVFIDDDGYPAPGWLAAVVSAVEKSPDFFGGPFLPYYVEKKPYWYDDRYGSAHVSDDGGFKPWGYCFSGGNMGWRVECFDDIGRFDPSLGMMGGTLMLGEETALQLSESAASLTRLLVPEMLLYHYVSPEKMTLRYIFRRSYVYGYNLDCIDAGSPLLAKGLFRFLLDVRLFLPLPIRFILSPKKFMSYCADFFSLHAIFIGIFLKKCSVFIKSFWR